MYFIVSISIVSHCQFKNKKKLLVFYHYIIFAFLGMRFGIMQSKVGLVSLLKNHKVTLNEKTKVPLKLAVNSFVPTTEGGIWLNAQKV